MKATAEMESSAGSRSTECLTRTKKRLLQNDNCSANATLFATPVDSIAHGERGLPDLLCQPCAGEMYFYG